MEKYHAITVDMAVHASREYRQQETVNCMDFRYFNTLIKGKEYIDASYCLDQAPEYCLADVRDIDLVLTC